MSNTLQTMRDAVGDLRYVVADLRAQLEQAKEKIREADEKLDLAERHAQDCFAIAKNVVSLADDFICEAMGKGA